jgi:hypothetical protein
VIGERQGVSREEAVAKTKELAALLRPVEATIQTVTSKERGALLLADATGFAACH